MLVGVLKLPQVYILFSISQDGGADVNVKDSDGLTPLIVAAYYGHENVCATLLRAGACAVGRDWTGQDAVAAAEQRGHVRVSALIQEHLQHEDKLEAPTVPLSPSRERVARL